MILNVTQKKPVGAKQTLARGPIRASAFHRYAYPLLALTRRDMARTYGKATLGRGWIVLQPALLLALYFLVFGFILRVRVGPNSGPGDFAVYLLSGMLPYLALADA